MEPSEGSGSQQFSFFSVVEIAATAAAMVGLATLTDVSRFLKSEFLAATIADEHKCLATDCQNDTAPPDHTKEKANFHIASDGSDLPIITIAGLNNLQSDGDGQLNLALIAEKNNIVPVNVVVINETGSAANLNSSLVPATDHQVASADGAQRDGGAIAIVDGTFNVVANHAETALAAQSSDNLSIVAYGASGNQDTISLADSANVINVVLTQGDASIDLAASGATNKITLIGDGNLQISGIVAGDSPQIVVSAGYTQTVSLSFGAAAPAIFAIQLNGSDNLSLAHVSTSAASTQLTLDSEGSTANVVTISDQAVATSKLDVTVIGVQDLTLNESAAAFNNTTLNTSGLSGSLTIGLDLNNVFQSVDLSQVNAANFIVGDSGNIALLHAASGSHIQLGSDLNIVDLTVAGATIAAPVSLGIDLNSDAGKFAITVNLLDAFYTSTLALNSTGAGLGGANTVETLTDTSLSTLIITGDSALTVNSLMGSLPGIAKM